MKKIIRLILIQCMVVTLFTSQAYAFKIPFFGKDNKDTVEESVEKANKEKEKEEKKKQKEAEKEEKKKQKEEEKRQKEEEKKQKEIEKNKDKDYLSVETTIFYKTNDDDDWNQKREFPKDDTCFVKVSSKAIYDKMFGKSEDVEVTYKFSGFKNTEIVISEGNAELITNSNGIIEYKKTITTDKKKDAETNQVIFRYKPSGQDSIVLDVIYGDNIKSKFDAKSTLFFK